MINALKTGIILLITLSTISASGQQKTTQEMKELRKELFLLKNNYDLFQPHVTVDKEASISYPIPPFIPRNDFEYPLPGEDLLHSLQQSMRAEIIKTDQMEVQMVFRGEMPLLLGSATKRYPLATSSEQSLERINKAAPGQPDSLISRPIDILGGLRLLLVSRLKSNTGEPLFQKKNWVNVRLAQIIPPDNSAVKGIELTIRLSADELVSEQLTGTAEIYFLPSVPAHKWVNIPLCQESIGKTFPFGETPVRVEAYALGNLLVSFNGEDNPLKGWKYTSRKEGRYLASSITAIYRSQSVNTFLYEFNHPNFSFGQWLQLSGFDLQEYKVSRQMMENDLKKRPPAAELQRFHQAMGWRVAHELNQNESIELPEYWKECRSWIETGYTLLLESGGNMDLLYTHDNQGEALALESCLMGGAIYTQYRYLNALPDFEAIHRAARRYFEKKKTLSENALTQAGEAQSDYIKQFRDTHLSIPLTETDLMQLFSPLSDVAAEEPERRAQWYQTNIADADTLVFYTPVPETDSSWLFRVYYQPETDQTRAEVGSAAKSPQATAPGMLSDCDASFVFNGTSYPLDQLNQILGKIIRMPSEAFQQGISGNVRLTFNIGEDNQVSGIKVHASPHEAFTKAVITALKTLKYQHAVVNGGYSRGEYGVFVIFLTQ